jgi:hypothetical protein
VYSCAWRDYSVLKGTGKLQFRSLTLFVA